MISPTTATSVFEEPVFLPGGRETIFGIVTRPTREAAGVGVILLPGGGFPISIGVNRLLVRLSRVLASDGFHVLRFDYHGTGESSGTVERFRLDSPFRDDVFAASQRLKEEGIERFVLVGWCFGARTAMACVDQMGDVAGLALISAPLGDFNRRSVAHLAQEWTAWRSVKEAIRLRWARGLVDRDRRGMYGVFIKQKLELLKRRSPDSAGSPDLSWVSSKALSQLSVAVGRQIPLLFVFGSSDEYYEDFVLAAHGELGSILSVAESRSIIKTMPGRIHGFLPVPGQDALIGLIREWIPRERSAVEVTGA